MTAAPQPRLLSRDDFAQEFDGFLHRLLARVHGLDRVEALRAATEIVGRYAGAEGMAPAGLLLPLTSGCHRGRRCGSEWPTLKKVPEQSDGRDAGF